MTAPLAAAPASPGTPHPTKFAIVTDPPPIPASPVTARFAPNTDVATTQPVVKFTYEDYRTTPADERYELLDGDLIMVPAPNLKRQRVQALLGQALHQFILHHELGEFFYAPCDVVLSDYVSRRIPANAV